MNGNINDIIERIRALQQELEAELDQRRAEFRYRLEGHKVRFEREILLQQRRFKQHLLKYIFTAKPRHLLTAPFIYAVFPAMLLLDFFVTLYQRVCFPLYGIPPVRRSDYMRFDRNQLGYLNLLEKINCSYCAYGNGLAGYFLEVVGRTEQYWCPIKHAERLLAAHSRYDRFTEFGDAKGYRDRLESIRKDFGTDEPPVTK